VLTGFPAVSVVPEAGLNVIVLWATPVLLDPLLTLPTVIVSRRLLADHETVDLFEPEPLNIDVPAT
jgi:hypothetical protein